MPDAAPAVAEEPRIITTPAKTRAVKAEPLQVEDNRRPVDEDEEEPLSEVPRLPSADERRKTGNHNPVHHNNHREAEDGDAPAPDPQSAPADRKTDES